MSAHSLCGKMSKSKKKQQPTSAKLLLQREYMHVMKNPPSKYFKVEGLVDDNIQVWEIYIVGPKDTLYENGVFRATLTFPDDYPMAPPDFTFETEILHPNVYRTGKVCISTLQIPKDDTVDSSSYWRPVLGIDQAVLSVISLLSDPNTQDPANAGAAAMYQQRREEYAAICRQQVQQSLKYLPKDWEPPEQLVKEAKEREAEEEKQRLMEQKALEEAEKEEEEEEDDDDEDWEYDDEYESDEEEEEEDDVVEVELDETQILESEEKEVIEESGDDVRNTEEKESVSGLSKETASIEKGKQEELSIVTEKLVDPAARRKRFLKEVEEELPKTYTSVNKHSSGEEMQQLKEELLQAAMLKEKLAEIEEANLKELAVESGNEKRAPPNSKHLDLLGLELEDQRRRKSSAASALSGIGKLIAKSFRRRDDSDSDGS